MQLYGIGIGHLNFITMTHTQIEYPNVVHIDIHTVYSYCAPTGSVVCLTTMWLRVESGDVLSLADALIYIAKSLVIVVVMF